jgi:5'-phosphate synthase pdxT subunit
LKTVGILALQGDFDAHRKAVERAASSQTGVPAIAVSVMDVRSINDLAACDALIIPGGESTTMWKLLEEERLTNPIRQFGKSKPIYGSCAGAILLAREVSHPAQESLGLMDISIERNAYGRQIDSRIAVVDASSQDPKQSETRPMEAVFIRAPVIRRAGPDARVLASYSGDPIWVEQGRHMVTTFHPELTSDTRVHRRLLEKL